MRLGISRNILSSCRVFFLPLSLVYILDILLLAVVDIDTDHAVMFFCDEMWCAWIEYISPEGLSVRWFFFCCGFGWNVTRTKHMNELTTLLKFEVLVLLWYFSIRTTQGSLKLPFCGSQECILEKKKNRNTIVQLRCLLKTQVTATCIDFALKPIELYRTNESKSLRMIAYFREKTWQTKQNLKFWKLFGKYWKVWKNLPKLGPTDTESYRNIPKNTKLNGFIQDHHIW